MAEAAEPDMSRQSFSVAYSGSGRPDDHTIDVEALAPALLAFGKLIRESNLELNGKKSKAKVLVVSDFEHKCFNINFETLVSIGAQLKSLIGDDKVKTAKDVLEWIGLVKPTVVSAVSFLTFLMIKRGRKVASKTELTDKDSSGFVSVVFEGEASGVVVHNHIYNLSENPRALKAARDAFSPIGQDGIDRVEFRDNDTLFQKFEPEQTEAILSSCKFVKEDKEAKPEDDVIDTPAWLIVYSPVFDPSATNWRFWMGRDIIYVDISDTKIAENAMKRGGAMTDDAYHVRLEITTPIDKNGKKGNPTYKIISVIKFVAATPSTQTSLFE